LVFAKKDNNGFDVINSDNEKYGGGLILGIKMDIKDFEVIKCDIGE